MTRTVAAIASLLLLAGAPGAVLAQDWSGAGGNNNWSTPGNWVGGFAPVPGAAFLTFGAAGTTFTPVADTAFGLQRLDISGATPYSITGGILTFGGSNCAINLSGATHSIANGLAFASLTTLTTSVDLAYAGVFAGGGGLIKSGTGRLTVSNVSGLMGAGPLTINGGVLQLGNGTTAPLFVPPNTVNNATIEFAGPAAPAIDIPTSLTGTGNVVVSSGRVTYGGLPHTYTGSTTLSGSGTVMTAAVSNNGALVIGAGARFEGFTSTFGSLAGAGELLMLGNVSVGGDGTTTTFSGTITGSGGTTFTKAGPGRLIMNNLNPLIGFGGEPFIVAGGVLQVGDGASAPLFLPPNVVNNATIEFVGPAAPSIDIPTSLTGTGNVVVSSGRVTYGGLPLTYAGSTTVLGSGTVMTAAVNNNAALFVGAGARMEAFASTFGSLAGSGELLLLGNITVGGDNTNTTFSGAINGGGGAIVKTGAGTLTLTGTVAAPTTALVQSGGLIVIGSLGAVTVAPGATLGGTGTIDNAMVISEGATLRIGIEGTTPVTQYDRINVAGTVAITESTLSLTGGYIPVVGDVFTIVAKDGVAGVTGTFLGLPEAGTLVFNGATLRISYGGGTGNDITLTTISSTAFVWNGGGANDNWGTGANWSGGVSPPSVATTFVAFPAASARFAPVIDAPWTINRLDIAASTSYAIAGQAISFAGTAPRLSSSGAAHGIADPLTLASLLTVSNTSALTLSGAIGGAAGLTKTGTGVLTLSGAGTYAGTTAVSAGTLLVNGAIASAVTVSAGGSLGGTGTVSGAVTVGVGGTLAPGVAAGILGTGNLSLSGTLLVEILGATPGTQYDSANVTGSVTLGGVLTLAGAFVPASGDTFTIITNDGADAVIGTFTGLPEGATLAFNGSTLQISYAGGTGNDVVLTAVTLASTTWSGGGPDPNWSTGGNWVGGTAPPSANTTFVTFGPSTRYGSRVDVPWTLNRMDVGGATGYVFLGQQLTFAGAAPQLNLSGATHSIANDLVFGSLTTLTTSVDLAYAGVFAGGGGLIKSGTGRLTVSNVSGLMGAGPLTINGGVLQLGNGTTAPLFVPPNTVNNATIEFAGPAAPAIDIPTSLTGTGNVVVSSGRVTYGGLPHTYTGSTTLSGSGTVMTAAVSNNGALVIGAGARFEGFTSTFGSLAGAGELLMLGNVSVGGDGTTTTFSGTITGSGGTTFTKAGPGRLIMNNLNPLIGFGGEPFIVAGGVLQVGDGASAPLFLPPNVVNNATIEFVGPAAPSIDIPTSLTGTGNVVVSSGRVTYGGLPLTYAGSTTVLGSGTVMTAAVNNNAALFVGAGARMEAFASTFGSLAGSGELLFLGNITVGGDNTNTTFSGTFIGNSNSFTKTGSGTLTLTNPNAAVAFAGSTFAVDGGVLRIGNGIMGPTFLPSNIVDNATIEFAGSFDPVTVAAGLTGTGNVLVSGGQVDVPGPPLAHAGSTTVTGTSILTGRVANNGALVIDAGARVDAVDSTVGSLTGAGLLNVLGAGIGVGGDGTSTTFSGVVAAGANLYKTGAGTLTLSGVNTNVGVMTINGGTLLLTGSSPGAVAVNAGGTFGGTGTVSGSVTVNAGGTLAPGLSPGIINTGNLTVAGALAVEILGTTIGTQYDNTNVTGTVTIAGGTLALTGAYVPLTGDVFTIVSNDAADAVTGTFAGLPEGAPIVFNGSTLRISYVGGTGNDITLTAISTTTVVWSGAGGNDNWSTPGNWVGGLAPLSGATTFVTFPAAAGRFSPAVDAPWTINRMDLNGVAASYNISGLAITFAGATPQINTSGALHGISNPLTLTSALTVSNASTLYLQGLIGGGFTVTKTGTGTLLINGTLTGSVTVASGTLGGTGTISGPVTVNAGATLAPGLSPGILNTGDLNLAGVALIEIDGATLGTQYDNINVTGTVTIAGATLTLAGAYVPVVGNTFTIIANDGADAVVGTFAGLAEGATVTVNGRAMAISYVGGTGNDVVLLAAPAAIAGLPVPTLSQWAMILLALVVGGIGARAVRRRSRGRPAS